MRLFTVDSARPRLPLFPLVSLILVCSRLGFTHEPPASEAAPAEKSALGELAIAPSFGGTAGAMRVELDADPDAPEAPRRTLLYPESAPKSVRELQFELRKASGPTRQAVTQAVVQYLLGITSDPSGLDFNGDGVVDSADVATSTVAPQPQPVLVIFPESIQFGDVQTPGNVIQAQVFLNNPGDGPLTIQHIGIEQFGTAAFSTDAAPPYVIPPSGSIAVNVSFQPSAAGTQAAFFAVNSNGAAGTSRIPLAGRGLTVTHRINAGGPNYVDPFGRTWVADTGLFNVGSTFNSTQPIAGTDLDPLYQTERWDAAGAPEMRFTIPAQPGSYFVTMHFAETFPANFAANKRTFNVIAEEVLPVLQNFDIYAEAGAGNKAVVKTFAIELYNTALRLDFQHVLENPKICAIEMMRYGALGGGLLSVSPGVASWGHVPVGTNGETRQITLQNVGGQPLNIQTITFDPEGGTAADFTLTVGGVPYSGSGNKMVFPGFLTLAPGEVSIATLQFSPKSAGANEFDVLFEGDFHPVSFNASGTGGDATGHPFLHVVINNPPVAIDFDGDGVELVQFIGADSHTHETGHVLSRFEWYYLGNLVSTEQNPGLYFGPGQHEVTLRIIDDNVPPETLDGTSTINVVGQTQIPGALALYYPREAGVLEAMLDAVPANASYGQILAEPFVGVGGAGNVGDSPFNQDVMVRLQFSANLPESGNYEFHANGGSDRRLFVDGAPASGPVALGAGMHAIEARFAVPSISTVPVSVTYTPPGSFAQSIPAAIVTHDQSSIIPVINDGPHDGLETGGNAVEITGLGFFPADQVTLHWGNLDYNTTNGLQVLPTSLRFTTPPGQGIIAYSVQTPRGTSDVESFTYSATGPAPINFSLRALASVNDPTSAAWGPDGRLYVGTLSGNIHIFQFDDAYNVIGTAVIPTLASATNNDILGIAFNPFDPPGTTRIYVGHSWLFANGGACFSGFSPYSGQISILEGPTFGTVIPLVTQLPVSNHDHAVNGIDFDNTGSLFVAIGGNTNAGIPACAIGNLPESPLSAALLRADITKAGFNGGIQYILTATQAPNNDQVFGGIVDVAPGVDISVWAPGLRNAYDVIFTTWGKFYGTDNGADEGFGAASTSATTQAGDPSGNDELELIEEGNYYGHPNRNRGRYDARQNVYHGPSGSSVPGVFTQPLLQLSSSTNGLFEYRANTFNGAMRGDIIVQKWNSTTTRIRLSADKRAAVGVANLPVQMTSLDVIQGPGGAILGIDYSSDLISVATPVDVTATGLSVFDIFPWRALRAGGRLFTIGGANFGTTANTSVTIGGVAAAIISVSPTRITGVIPQWTGPAAGLLDVVVKVGNVTRILPAAFLYLFEPGAPQPTNFWMSGPSMPESMGEVACGVIGNKMYIVGESSDDTLAFDLSTGTWDDEDAHAERPFEGNHHCAEVINGKWYLFGGFGGGSEGKVQIYDPALNSWTTGADIPFPSGSGNSALINGEVFFAGGIANNTTVNNHAKYNPTTNTWATLAPMPVGRNHAAAGTDGTNFYVFGGRGPGSGNTNIPANGFDDVMIYHPVGDFWESTTFAGSPLARLPQARGGQGRAAFFNGKFYVIGGETVNGAGATAQHVYNRVDIYDPSTNSWSLGATMPTARHGIFPVVALGRIYVAGGGTQAGFSGSAFLQIYTP